MPADLPKITAHFLRLSREDRHMRFGHSLSDQAVQDYCDALSWGRTLLYGHVKEGEILGLTELSWNDQCLYNGSWPETVELAVTVDAQSRHQGLGYALLARGITAARNRSFKRIYMVCLAGNRQMRALAKRFNYRISLDDGDVEAILELPPLTQGTLFEEAWQESGAFFDLFWEQLHPLTQAALPHEWALNVGKNGGVTMAPFQWQSMATAEQDNEEDLLKRA